MATQEPLSLAWIQTHLESREGALFYQGSNRKFRGRSDLSPAQAAWALEYGIIDASVFAKNADLPLTLENLIQWEYRQTNLFWWYGMNELSEDGHKHPLRRVRVELVRTMEDAGVAFVWITPPKPTHLKLPTTPFKESVERRMAHFVKQTDIRPCQVWLIPLPSLVKLIGKRSLFRLADTKLAWAKASIDQKTRLDWPLSVYRKAPGAELPTKSRSDLHRYADSLFREETALAKWIEENSLSIGTHDPIVNNDWDT